MWSRFNLICKEANSFQNMLIVEYSVKLPAVPKCLNCSEMSHNANGGSNYKRRDSSPQPFRPKLSSRFKLRTVSKIWTIFSSYPTRCSWEFMRLLLRIYPMLLFNRYIGTLVYFTKTRHNNVHAISVKLQPPPGITSHAAHCRRNSFSFGHQPEPPHVVLISLQLFHTSEQFSHFLAIQLDKYT